jgi:hypothetical protein
MEGPGVYLYNDGRAEIGTYSQGVDQEEGCRFSPCRLQAWRLKNGKVVGDVRTGEIPLSEATEMGNKKISPSYVAQLIVWD